MKLNWKKSKVTIFGGITLLAAIYVFVESVNLNPLYLEGATFWCILFTAYVLAWVFFKYGTIFAQQMEQRQSNAPYRTVPKLSLPKWALWTVLVPWAFVAVMYLISTPLISYAAYRDQLGDPEVTAFSSDVQAIDVSQIPIVDRDLAYKLADKKLGERPSLGSQVYLGEPTIQQVAGKLQWVVPLQHSGFFKWLTNMQGTPGYIVVSATNINDVTYVEDYFIKYQPNCYLLDDLTRNVRFTGGLFTGITDYSFELDDEGRPFWVVSTYKNTRGFALPEATGAIIVDASTGQKQRYTIENLPEWVDRIQPEDFVMNQINNKGRYIHGIFNFANKDKYQTSQGEMVVYNNGKCYMFTGLTSVGRDESAIGFMMVDMVTKKSIRYQISGATEYSAQASAEGKVQHLRYDASFPLILNINSLPTYFMTLKDAEGLIKQYAFVSVENYSIVGTGETIREALNDYSRSLKNEGSSAGVLDQTVANKVSGAVKRIASEYNGSETVYKMILEQHSDTIFIVPAAVSDQLALTQPGDRVTIEYYESGSTVQSGVTFKNSSL